MCLYLCMYEWVSELLDPKRVHAKNNMYLNACRDACYLTPIYLDRLKSFQDEKDERNICKVVSSPLNTILFQNTYHVLINWHFSCMVSIEKTKWFQSCLSSNVCLEPAVYASKK